MEYKGIKYTINATMEARFDIMELNENGDIELFDYDTEYGISTKNIISINEFYYRSEGTSDWVNVQELKKEGFLSDEDFEHGVLKDIDRMVEAIEAYLEDHFDFDEKSAQEEFMEDIERETYRAIKG